MNQVNVLEVFAENRGTVCFLTGWQKEILLHFEAVTRIYSKELLLKTRVMRFTGPLRTFALQSSSQWDREGRCWAHEAYVWQPDHHLCRGEFFFRFRLKKQQHLKRLNKKHVKGPKENKPNHKVCYFLARNNLKLTGKKIK